MRDRGVVIGKIGTPQACVVCFSHVCVQRFEIARLVVETKRSKGSEMLEIEHLQLNVELLFGSGKYIR